MSINAEVVKKALFKAVEQEFGVIPDSVKDAETFLKYSKNVIDDGDSELKVVAIVVDASILS